MSENPTFLLGMPGESVMIDLEKLHCWELVVQEIENYFPFVRLDLEVEVYVDETMLRVHRRKSPHTNAPATAVSQTDESLKLDLKRAVPWQDISQQVALTFPKRELYELAASTEGGALRFVLKSSLPLRRPVL